MLYCCWSLSESQVVADDALNTTDPTQTLRKPAKADAGPCKQGVMGLQGHCGSGGIRDYNFCAGIALLWLRGGE
jgi:hypothetical protein